MTTGPLLEHDYPGQVATKRSAWPLQSLESSYIRSVLFFTDRTWGRGGGHISEEKRFFQNKLHVKFSMCSFNTNMIS